MKKIYTKTGDEGRSSLFSGGRVTKDDSRLEAYGTLDELNAVLGSLRAEDLPPGTDRDLDHVQQVLFVIGGTVADAEQKHAPDPEQWSASSLESWIDDMDARLSPLTAFILPGGTRAAALAQVARTVCRRAERRMLTADEEHQCALPGTLAYLNRLSDALFVLARSINAVHGVKETTWTP